jgi:hypothetical protein
MTELSRDEARDPRTREIVTRWQYERGLETKTAYESTLRRSPTTSSRRRENKHAFTGMNPSHHQAIGEHIAKLQDATSRRDWPAMDSAVSDLDSWHRSVAPGGGVSDKGDLEVPTNPATLMPKMDDLRARSQRLGRWISEL